MILPEAQGLMGIKRDPALSRPAAHMICCWAQAPSEKELRDILSFCVCVCVIRPHGHVKTVAGSLPGLKEQGRTPKLNFCPFHGRSASRDQKPVAWVPLPWPVRSVPKSISLTTQPHDDGAGVECGKCGVQLAQGR